MHYNICNAEKNQLQMRWWKLIHKEPHHSVCVCALVTLISLSGV